MSRAVWAGNNSADQESSAVGSGIQSCVMTENDDDDEHGSGYTVLFSAHVGMKCYSLFLPCSNLVTQSEMQGCSYS